MNTTFEEVHDEFHERIGHYLRRLVGEADAEDLTQEVFLKVHKGLKTFKGESKLSTWIYRIATNTGLDMLRSAWHHQSSRTVSIGRQVGEPDLELEDQDSPTTKKTPPAPQQMIKLEGNACIRAYVDRLPPDFRTVIVLSEFKDLKNQEIADILEISLDAVKIRLHRARARLRKEFEVDCEVFQDENGELSCDRKVTGCSKRE